MPKDGRFENNADRDKYLRAMLFKKRDFEVLHQFKTPFKIPSPSVPSRQV